MPAEERNVSNSRNFAGSICSLSWLNHGNWRASFKLAYASSPDSLGNMLRMSDPRLPARAVPGSTDKMAITAAIQMNFLAFILFLRPCTQRFDSTFEFNEKSIYSGYRLS